jgi:monovalent cation:H+ antiporter-2, CPA2 family
VFLIAIGMSVNFASVFAQPILMIGGVVALIAGKAAISAVCNRLFGMRMGPALRSGLILGPAGEFSFVILGSALALGLVSREASQLALTISALSMALIPILWSISGRLEARSGPQAAPADHLLPEEEHAAPRVVIAGFGRVGAEIAGLLETHKVPYIAIDLDADTVTRARRQGKPVYFGDISRPEMLSRCHIATARALVVTMDAPKRAAQLVETARALSPDLVIVARARDAKDAARLYGLGATDAAPETIEASLQLAETVLVDVGVPVGHAIASVHDRRAALRAEIQGLAPDADVQVRRRRTVRAWSRQSLANAPEEGGGAP